MGNNHIDIEMKRAITDGVFPSAELLVAKEGNVFHHHHYGDARPGTLFDIASLTKPICTATLTMMLTAEGLLKQNDTIYQWLGGARLAAHKAITIEMLLNHTGGLPAWQPYYRELPLSLVGTEGGKRLLLDACLKEEPIATPGTTTRYSDIGYMILGMILEEAGGMFLDELFLRRIAKPFELHDTFFRNTKNQRRFAPTEDCPWRRRVLHGEVHDQNAYALGGVAGHAGLFSTATDIHHFITECVKTSDFDFSSVKNRNGESFLNGWNLPSPQNSSAGHHFSQQSIGHLGFTGCSIWIDFEQHISIILLTNRIHPSITNEKIKSFRPKIHDLVMKELIKGEGSNMLWTRPT